jgi:hypothetical protein
MPDTPSITLVKEFPYRGVAEQWSNTYHFTGTTPSSDAAWKALALAIFTTERAVYNEDHALVQSYGYEAGNEHSVAQIDHRSDALSGRQGTNTLTSGQLKVPGDAAVWLRALIGVSIKGKKVYVRKYFHGGKCDSGQPDNASTQTRANISAHGTACLAGGWPGGAKWSGPQGQTATLPQSSPFMTTRTLKRRGKRP